MIPGEGVTAVVDGKKIKAGNLKLLQDVSISHSHAITAGKYLSEGSTVIYIAVDAADIALVDDEIKELPHLLALSKRMMRTIKLNLTFSMGLNFLAIILAITGILNPVVGALVHNAGSVAAIINSALLLSWRKK